MKIATLPKSGTHLFMNCVEFLKNERGLSIAIDHIVMPNRPPFIDDTTPCIVTVRDPRGYFMSLLNWFNRQTAAYLSGEMPEEEAPRYFIPSKAARWGAMSDAERLFALMYDTPGSLLVVSSRETYDAILSAKDKPNCYIAKFEDYAPAKNIDELGDDTIQVYIDMFGHLGIKLSEAEVHKMLAFAWGHSVTWSDTPGEVWKQRFDDTVSRNINDLFRDVMETFGYPVPPPDDE